MRPDDFFEDEVDDFLGELQGPPRFRKDFVRQLRQGPADGHSDIAVAVGLARLVHDDLEAFGTDGGQLLREPEIREAILALRAVLDRIAVVDLEMPFRDYTTFKSFWLREGAYGSWQARRDLLENIFGEVHDRLADQESAELSSALAVPVSPRGRTGWARIDAEIAEIRRHFLTARTPQDYRNVGNDCIILTEELSRQLYSVDQHLRPGESEPPVANTKQRLERVVEDALPGSGNATLRKLLRASIEVAQALKHGSTPRRREAGMAADSVILLATLLRRMHDGEEDSAYS